MLLAGFIVAAIAVLVAGLQLWKRLGTKQFAIAVVAVAAVVGALVLLVRVGGCADPPDPLELEHDGTLLVHPFGFEIKAPPAGFTPDHALESQLGNGYMRCWAWTRATDLLIVCALEIPVHSRAELAVDAAAVRRGIDRAADSLRTSTAVHAIGQGGTQALETLAATFPRWDTDSVIWSGDRGEARLAANLAGASIRVRLVSVDDGVGVAWSMSQGTALDATVDSLRRH